jgi:hypothetical protein
MTFCEKYIIGDQGMLVDMQFLPRIKEGEVRILMVGSKPIFVVHKKPADTADAFSATLYSGAVYTYDKPEKWDILVKFFLAKVDLIKDTLKEKEVPLIWTADFILDWDEHKKDRYILGEINCSCVGFTSQLDMGIQEAVAEEAIRQVNAK